MWLLQLRVWGCWGCSRWRGSDRLCWADSFKRASSAAPHSAALSLRVTEWGGFRPSCALGELGGYKKRRCRAAGRQRPREAERRKGEDREAASTRTLLDRRHHGLLLHHHRELPPLPGVSAPGANRSQPRVQLCVQCRPDGFQGRARTGATVWD